MTAYIEHPPVSIGDWRIEPTLHRLDKGGVQHRITPKMMHVLVCLIAQAGDVVTREVLLAEVWAGTVVSPDMVTRTVSALRKVLGDTQQPPRYIETIPKVGYRLVAEVAPLVSSDFPSEPQHATNHAAFRRGELVLVSVLLLGCLVWWSMNIPSASSVDYSTLDVRPLTTFSGREMRPALSPDGNHVAFSWKDPANETWDLYVMGVGGGPPLRLTDDAGHEMGAAWSPDEQRIAFMQFVEEVCSLWMVPALGGPKEHIGSCGKNVSADIAWSPDGTWLAYSDQPSPDSGYAIFRLNLETGKRQPITTPSAQHWGDSSPAFSPDSRHVAFSRSVSTHTQDIFFVSIEGGAPQRLTTAQSLVAGVTWHPDGTDVIAAFTQGSTLGLWQVSIEGGAPRWLVAGGHYAHWPRMASRGHGLVYNERRPLVNVWKQSLIDTTRPPTPRLPSSRSTYHPAFSPSGAQLAYISTASGTPELWVSEDSTQTRLTFFEQGFVGSPTWSPDGTKLAFDVRVNGQADIYTVHADGSNLMRVTDGAQHDLAPSWSNDGTMLYFGSNRSGSWQIWKKPYASDQATSVLVVRGYAARETPSGEGVIFSRFDEPGLWLHTDLESSPRLLVGTTALHDLQNWQLTKTGIYYLAGVSPRYTLFYYSFKTEQPSPVFQVEHVPDRRTFAVAPDERAVVFSRMIRSESDLMFIPNL